LSVQSRRGSEKGETEIGREGERDIRTERGKRRERQRGERERDSNGNGQPKRIFENRSEI